MPIPEFDDPNFYSESKPSVVAGGAGDQIRSCFFLQSARYRTGLRGVIPSISSQIWGKSAPSQRRSSGLGIGCEEVFVFPVAFLFEVLERNETKRRGVNTIAESGWGGAIGKDVAQVGVAFH